jgi:hypothetical protein
MKEEEDVVKYKAFIKKAYLHEINGNGHPPEK